MCLQALVKRAFGAPDLEEDFAQDKAEQVRLQDNHFIAVAEVTFRRSSLQAANGVWASVLGAVVAAMQTLTCVRVFLFWDTAAAAGARGGGEEVHWQEGRGQGGCHGLGLLGGSRGSGAPHPAHG